MSQRLMSKQPRGLALCSSYHYLPRPSRAIIFTHVPKDSLRAACPYLARTSTRLSLLACLSPSLVPDPIRPFLRSKPVENLGFHSFPSLITTPAPANRAQLTLSLSSLYQSQRLCLPYIAHTWCAIATQLSLSSGRLRKSKLRRWKRRGSVAWKWAG